MKWLDPRGRHLTHVCDRWSKSRAAAIQLAFFNGDGYESWVCWLKYCRVAFAIYMVREVVEHEGQLWVRRLRTSTFLACRAD